MIQVIESKLWFARLDEKDGNCHMSNSYRVTCCKTKCLCKNKRRNRLVGNREGSFQYKSIRLIISLRHLHRAKDRNVHFRAANHCKRIRGGEERRPRDHGDGLLTSVDKVGIYGRFRGVGTEAQETVLTLQLDSHTWRQVIADQSWHTDAEIGVHKNDAVFFVIVTRFLARLW